MTKILCEIKGERLEIEESELEKLTPYEEGHINGQPAGCYATEYYKQVDGVRTLVHRSVEVRAHQVDPPANFAA